MVNAIMASSDSKAGNMFTISSPISRAGARLGQLALANRHAIKTPNYIGVTSRGMIPHMTPQIHDTQENIGGVYMAFEDCKQSILPIILLATATSPE